MRLDEYFITFNEFKNMVNNVEYDGLYSGLSFGNVPSTSYIPRYPYSNSIITEVSNMSNEVIPSDKTLSMVVDKLFERVTPMLEQAISSDIYNWFDSSDNVIILTNMDASSYTVLVKSLHEYNIVIIPDSLPAMLRDKKVVSYSKCRVIATIRDTKNQGPDEYDIFDIGCVYINDAQELLKKISHDLNTEKVVTF